MSKVLYSATMSLDGYIAGPDGDMSWLSPYLGPNPEIDALQRRIGALLIGARTFRGDDPNRGTDKEGAFSGTWTGPSFVVTHRPPAEPVDGVEFHADLETGLAAAKAAAGDDYVNILGADIARQCLELGELDEVLAIIAPVHARRRDAAVPPPRRQVGAAGADQRRDRAAGDERLDARPP